jgi:hypothetical protein
MVTWSGQKADFLETKGKLDEQTTDSAVNKIVNDMNTAIMRYTNTAGISQNPNENPDYTLANKNYVQLQSLQKEYSQLTKTLSTLLRTMTNTNDIASKLKTAGELRNDIIKLEKELINVKQDADTSKTRQSTIETTQQNISWYQGFAGYIGFTRPLYQISIPFLIGFGIFLLFLSGLILKEFFLPIASSNSQYMNSSDTEGSIFSLFTDSRFFAALGGLTLVVVVLVILSLTGRLGKNIR